MYLFLFNLFSWIKGRERENALSSSNDTHSSYLHSLLAPKSLSVTLFPSSATPRPHHPFRPAAIPLKFPLSSSIPSHWLSSPPSPCFLSQSSHSALPKLTPAPSLQEHWDCKRSTIATPNVCVWTWTWQGRQHRAVGESLFTQSLLSTWPWGKEQSLAEPSIYTGMRVLQSPADFHTDRKVRP